MTIFLVTISYLTIVVCAIVAVAAVVAIAEFVRVIVTTFVKRKKIA
ncbi:MAG: hypothetical protein MUO60_03005 [Clostridiaceae bacterium]|nr:hypothetical protein [Clostridiaceae bacterium]